MSQWIYILGERSGKALKIGTTKEKTVAPRERAVNRDQMSDDRYVCLAAVLGSAKDEATLHRTFAALRLSKGSRKEYYEAGPELVEYAAWLRSQWFSSLDAEDNRDDWIEVEPDVWLPDGNGRRMPQPTADPEKMVQDFDNLEGPLANTAWKWLPSPKASIQDYFTPPEIVAAAAEGMDGIDLDAASHWLANRTHKIPRYFHIGHSAFEHDWEGRVWLNPPYGHNDEWWPRVLEFVATGQVEQICILSPVWAFTTGIARPLVAESSALLLLEPTPKFWGNSEGRTGKNHPHAILYIGDRPKQVLAALSQFGIPMRFAFDEVTP